MTAEGLVIHAYPELDGARLVLGFTGWMDGGGVSTGTVGYLARKLHTQPLAEIEPAGFYIYNFPGSMEVSALFRPHCHIDGGLVRQFQPPRNTFQFDASERLILFHGKEPNLGWERFAECILTLAETFRVQAIYFVGSYAGVVPHTRDPRLYATVSVPAMKPDLEAHGFRFTEYEGPAHFCTYLVRAAAERGLRMATLVAEIPAYVQGSNPRCIEAMVRTLARVLGLRLETDDLRQAADAFEAKVGEALADKPDLAEMVQKMEAQYDSEVFETQMGDLKEWLEERGIRLD